jgi:TPR repeat protein
MRYNGECDEPNFVEALNYFKLAAKQGNPTAQFLYGLMRYKGEGDEPNLVEALKYYKSAADQGHRLAQFQYASMRYKGEGDEPNLVEALKYSKLAADQGHTEAQSLYEVMHASEKEKGVVLNKDNSVQDVSRLLKRKYEPTPEQEENESNAKKLGPGFISRPNL